MKLPVFIAALCLLFLAHCHHPASSLPVLSLSSTSVTCASSANTSSCASCPITVLLTYPTPTTAVGCTPIPNYPDASLYYAYNATNYTQGTLSLYRAVNSSSPCSSSSFFTSFSLSNVIQCSNSSSQTQSWQFGGGNVTALPSPLSPPSTSNSSTPFPYNATTGCSNCSSSLTCPAYNASGFAFPTSSSGYVLQTNFSLTSFCPSTCNPTYLATFVAFQSQCLALAGSDPRLLCGCNAGGYIGELMSNCFVSDASSQLLLNIASGVFANCSQYWQRPSSSFSSSSTGMAGPSSTGAAGTSGGGSVNVGAIVGGVLGGAAGLIILILILRCCMRMQAKGHNIEIHRRPKPSKDLKAELEIEGRKLQEQRDGLTGADEEDDGDEEFDEEDDEGDEDDEVEDDDVEQQKTRITAGGVPPVK